MDRNIFLEDIPLDEAWTVFEAALEKAGRWQPFPAESIPLAAAAGRITAAPVWARLSSPHYHAAAMDGYAVRARDTIGATETRPVMLTLVADAHEQTVPRPAQAVNTGQSLPDWANAVIMIEHTQPAGSGIEIRAAVPPWQHVRPMGEDMVATQLVLPANHRLRPVDLGAIAGAGHATVEVYRRPRVAIIPTGSELVSPDEVVRTGIRPGQIIEYNSLVLAAQVTEWGGQATRFSPVPDEKPAILAAVREALANHDLVLINAGSSAGSEDYTAAVVREVGTLLVHGVAVRPGHPVVLGTGEWTADGGRRTAEETGDWGPETGEEHNPQSEIRNPKSMNPQSEIRNPKSNQSEIRNPKSEIPIIGVPGYPVSAALTGEVFVQPLLARWLGQPAPRPETLAAMLTRKINSPVGDDDFVRVAVGRVGERVMATPISRGAGVITSLVRADGLVRIPRFSEGADAGTTVTVQLYRTPAEIAQTIVAIGSHDLTLDLLAQFLAAQGEGLRLTSANVGSMGGLLALRRGEAHLAGTHLLDPETGEYNHSYLERYCPGIDIVLVTLAGREQGWIVPAGNPLGLTGWDDMARPEVSIVNRQRGAGTRVLLDFELQKRGIDPAGIAGYTREEYTHLAVAAAVASGTAAAGLGIRAAAQALELDFVPLAQERYDLAIPRHFYESELLRPVLAALQNPAFRNSVAAMPGYDVREMGMIQSKED